MGFLYPVGMILSLIAVILLLALMIKSFTSNNLTGSKELQISAGVIGGAGVVSIFADYFLVEAELKEDEARWKKINNVFSPLGKEESAESSPLASASRKRVSKRSRKSKRVQ
jgi:hypothetical protein